MYIMPCRNHFLFLENLFVFLSFSFFLAIIIDYNKEEGSHQSEPGTQYQVNRRKEPVRGEKSSQKPWRVLVVAFYMLLLERSFIRDLSLLCLKGAREVGGDVEKVRS
jgi:hypothetical protein